MEQDLRLVYDRNKGWKAKTPGDNPFYNLGYQKLFVGINDAQSEWNDPGVLPASVEDLFTTTPAYELFREIQTTFVYGRRGSGKSAMLRMLQYEIRQGKVPKYSGCWVIRTDALQGTVRTYGPALFAESAKDHTREHFFGKLVLWLVHLGLMADVLYQHHRHKRLIGADERRDIEQYLIDMGMSPHAPQWNFTEAAIRYLETALRVGLEDRSTDRVVIRAQMVEHLLATDLHTRAWEAAKRVIRDRNGLTLVQLDSPDVFNLEQVPLFKGILAALIDIRSRAGATNYLAKASIPAEMHAYVGTEHPDRTGGAHSVLLLWRYSELLGMAAKRVGAYASAQGIDVPQLKRLWHLLDSGHHDDSKAEGVLHSLFPMWARNNASKQVKTFPYVLRHTLRSPREFLFLLNSIMTVAEAMGVPWGELAVSEPRSTGSYATAANVVRWGVHAHIGQLVDRLMHVPKLVDEDFILLVQAAFSGNKAFFPVSDIEARLKGPFRPFRERLKRGSLDTPQARRKALLSSGLLGVYRGINWVPSQSSYFVLANFAFQMTDGDWELTGDEVVVAHPILYERYLWSSPGLVDTPTLRQRRCPHGTHEEDVPG